MSCQLRCTYVLPNFNLPISISQISVIGQEQVRDVVTVRDRVMDRDRVSIEIRLIK